MVPSLSRRVIAVVQATALSSAIAAVATFSWNGLLIANLSTTPAVPWSVPTMAVVLYLLWRYLAGAWWPRRTASARRALLRAAPIDRKAFVWSVIAGALGVVALVGLWIALVEIAGSGGNPTLPDVSAYPPLTIALGIAMGSLVSPLSEEAAFRGYAQTLLERVFPAAPAIAMSSVLFALWHGPTQGFVWNKLLFFFVVGLLFGVIAYVNRSILPGIPAHILGDVTFFTLVWPNDAGRPLLSRDGVDAGFWIAVVVTIVFFALSALAVRQVILILPTHSSDGRRREGRMLELRKTTGK